MSDESLDQKLSPMMHQWNACKKAAGNSLLFFRLGDFYEAFYDDAVTMARVLDLTLTKRQEIPMCGVPHHTHETYIDRLITKGYRVAIAEQTEDPRTTKGIVKREVVRVVTPGSIINSSLLSDHNNNYIISVACVGRLFGIAILDLTTAEFRVIEFENEHDLVNEIYRVSPKEVVIAPKTQDKLRVSLFEAQKSINIVISNYEDWRFDHQIAHDFLTSHLKVKTLDGFGLSGMVAAINAAGGLLSYLQESLCISIAHITELQVVSSGNYMAIDRSTQRHLELTESLQDGSKRDTLLSILDATKTPMGARLLRQWIKQPLIDPAAIHDRQNGVSACYHSKHLLDEITILLDSIRDLERLNMKISSGYASPRDLVALKNSLTPLPVLKNILQSIMETSALLVKEENAIEELPEIIHLISRAIVEEPPAKLNDGNIFKEGYNQELDELKEIGRSGNAWLIRYQTELKDSTGIKTLKVGFNRLSGYYIEVSRGQSEKMPDTFHRRQTLANAERFTTQELKEYETKVLHAEDRISAIENELFTALRLEIAKYRQRILRTAQGIAVIDCLHSLALIAHQRHYTRPIVNDSTELKIIGGRHPVIESAKMAERFITNDTYLNGDDQRLFLITGPNMAGKSTYIRQVALITIMAQIGSFVPAVEASIGVVDKVFSRIGASDDLSRGHSTFMVEMTETANILNNATSRSLVILDEIGRGTSTYDGISIAWAVAEYLLLTEGRMAKTLFATHYWELTKLEGKVHGAVNYHVAVHEREDGIVFLRKIIRGGTDKSYGIHVGRLAGLPATVLSRAKEILVHLEENSNQKGVFEPSPAKRAPAKQKSKNPVTAMQLSFFN